MLALSWAVGGLSFPFGENDIEGADMGSLLFAAQPQITGMIFATCCAAGVVVALAMLRQGPTRTRRWIISTAGWLLAGTMIVTVPDIRVLQSTAYALLLVFAKLDWAVVNQGIVLLGGACWVATIGYADRRLNPQSRLAP